MNDRYTIDGHSVYFCRIYRRGKMVDGWACDCDAFVRELECEHADGAAALHSAESEAEKAGSSTMRQ